MKLVARLFTVFALFAIVLGTAAPVHAATVTRTITEAQLNATYRLPASVVVTSRTVDLQPGRVVITTTTNTPRTKAETRKWIFAPSLVNNQVNWVLVSATKNGAAIASSVQDQVNLSISTSWTRFLKAQMPAGKVTNITVNDSAITYTIETAR